MLPFHGLVFSGMVNRIVAEAEGTARSRKRRSSRARRKAARRESASA